MSRLCDICNADGAGVTFVLIGLYRGDSGPQDLCTTCARDVVAAANELRDRESGPRREPERRYVWGSLAMERRETLVLEILGEDQLLIRQLVTRLNAALETTDPMVRVYNGHVRYVVTQMVREGQLDRVKEPFHSTGRFGYFRRRELDGPIADLERTFRDEGDA